MPDHVVILFMFAVLASFGIVWIANELRLRYPARYLEYNFYFILSALCYGFVNWIAPFVVLSLAEVSGAPDPAWFVVIFVLIGVPILLIKLYFLYLLFRELLARQKPAWFNRFSLAVSGVVLLVSVWYVKSYYDGVNLEQVRGFIVSLGLLVVAVEFLIMIHFIVATKAMKTRVIGAYSLPFGWMFLGGYSVYVFVAYSGLFLPGRSLLELAPYIYFIIHGLPLLALWLFHQNEPVAVLNTGTRGIEKFIEKYALTPKEADILKQVIRGASNREIAEYSNLSPHTVRNHIYNIYNKTGIRNRFQLLAICQADENALVD
jgi:DNA-binding CsgD family transcriptional regulator